MDEIKKTGLLDGAGSEDEIQWITVNGAHIPIKEGQTKEEAIEEKFNNKKEKSFSNNEEPIVINKLIDTLKKIKKVKTQEIYEYIKSLKPIKLTIKDQDIIAEFDKYTANKNIYGHGRSDTDGYNYKLSNINMMPEFIENSKYTNSKLETGKNKPQHKDVKEWHYFNKSINTDKGIFDVVVNVRDKGKNKYVYEVALKRKKT